MSESPANPVIVALLFILRCLVPLAILFGISYLLRRLGFVAETPEPPSGYDEEGKRLLHRPRLNRRKKKEIPPMTVRNLPRQPFWWIAAGAFALALSLLSVSPADAKPPVQETEKFCLSCHGNPDLSLTLPNGDALSLYISQDDLDHSVHGSKGIECEACHNNIKEYPHPELHMAELHRRWIATVFAAYADFQIRTNRASFQHRHFHQYPDAIAIDDLEWIYRIDFFLNIGNEESSCIVAADAQRRLRQIIRPKAEELRNICHFVCRDGTARNLDHRAYEVLELHTFFFHYLCRHASNDPLLMCKLLHIADERDHDFGFNPDAARLDICRCLENGTGLHFRDLREDLKGEVNTKEVELLLTIAGQQVPYVMQLKKYDLAQDGGQARVISCWMVHELRPKS